LPIAVPQEEWEPITAKDPAWNIYGDGRIYDDAGDQVPGNWGTLNLGPSSNSTESINDQILNGLQQSHLDALRSEGRISSNEMIDSSEAFNSNGDPGLSAGMKSSIDAILGQTRLIPIYDTMTGEPGNNLEFHITGWGVALVTDSRFKGSKNTFVAVKKAYTFDGTLRPNRDLSVTEGVIEGAYTTPVLVE